MPCNRDFIPLRATHWLMDFRVVPDLWLSGGTCSGDSDLGIWCRSRHPTVITVVLIIGALFLNTPASGELDLRECRAPRSSDYCGPDSQKAEGRTDKSFSNADFCSKRCPTSPQSKEPFPRNSNQSLLVRIKETESFSGAGGNAD